MQLYIKKYMNHFDYVTAEEIICEACGRPAVDIHHITGRGKGKDVIENLIALCRKCHERAHGSLHPVSKGGFQYIHNNFLSGQRKAFLK
jgi:thymidine kinase